MSGKTYKKSVFIFRRDLRLEDNTGLLAAGEMSDEVIPVFCFDPRQTDRQANEYFSQNAFRFMCDALLDLDEHLKKRDSKLHILEGESSEELEKLLNEADIDVVFFNRDYTPFARKRDEAIESVCESCNVEVHGFHDVGLTVPGEVLTGSSDPYRVFTPFEKKARENDPAQPRRNNFRNFGILESDLLGDAAVIKKHRPAGGEEVVQTGSRAEATSVLQQIEDFKNYSDERNKPAVRGTTRLSAHLKFGTISPREVYWVVRKHLGSSSSLISELYWRDFYMHISWHYPEVFGENFNSDYDDLEWSRDEDDFTRWQEGKTGFPIVDAGMRELLATGWMHNRVRMIVASFLTKDLAIDWRWGEKHFAQHLVDYDPSSNNGGWQWAASTGADAQPYFRIFNPWTQGKTHDPEAEYIKKWVPELADVPPADIHKLGEKGVPEGVDYPEPMVNHKEKYHEAKARYQKARQ